MVTHQRLTEATGPYERNFPNTVQIHYAAQGFQQFDDVVTRSLLAETTEK